MKIHNFTLSDEMLTNVLFDADKKLHFLTKEFKKRLYTTTNSSSLKPDLNQVLEDIRHKWEYIYNDIKTG